MSFSLSRSRSRSREEDSDDVDVCGSFVWSLLLEYVVELETECVSLTMCECASLSGWDVHAWAYAA